MSRIEENKRLNDVWCEVHRGRTPDESRNNLLAAQCAFLSDISRSLAVIADSLSGDIIYSNNEDVENIDSTDSAERSGSDDGEEKRL